MDQYSWIRHLSPTEVREFVKEIVEAATAGQPVVHLVASWMSTAEVYSDSDLMRRLQEPTDGDFGPVV